MRYNSENSTCSCVLVNQETNKDNLESYFIIARHCITPTFDESIEHNFYFNYQSPNQNTISTEFRSMQPLYGTGLSGGVGGPEIFPGVWISGANVLSACPKVNICVGTENPSARIHVKPRAAGQAAFQYDGFEPVSITAAGSLGIGTNSTQAPLHIQSTSSNPDNNILIIDDHTVTDGSQEYVIKQDGSMYSRRVYLVYIRY